MIGKKPHHHTPINAEAKKDLLMWRRFLFDFNCLRPIPSFKVVYYDQIRFFTDTSAKLGNGLGCFLDGEWCFVQWSEDFLSESPSTALLELLAIIMAVLLWGERLANQHIILRTDSLSSVHMLQNSSSKCPYCMVSVRLFYLKCMQYNLDLRCVHTPGVLNGIGDSISRGQFQRLRRLAPDTSLNPLSPSKEIWPASMEQLRSMQL